MKLGNSGEWATANSVTYLVTRADTEENVPGSRIAFFKHLLTDSRVNVNQEETEYGELPIHRAAIMDDSR